MGFPIQYGDGGPAEGHRSRRALTVGVVDQNHVELTEDDGDTVHVTFDKALIATGTRPFRPDHVPFDDTRVFDSDSILEIPALPRSMTVIGGGVFGKSTAYVSDMFNGRLFPLDAATGRWGDPLSVPGHRKWYGYLSGGHRFGDHLYFDHSTWTGANKSIDGQPHHFIGRWTVFDHARKAFSRLDFPARPDETIDDLQADYAITYKDGLYLLAVHRKSPRRALVLRSRPLPTS